MIFYSINFSGDRQVLKCVKEFKSIYGLMFDIRDVLFVYYIINDNKVLNY